MCFQCVCNGPCRDRTLGHSVQSPTPKPLDHKGTWTTQSRLCLTGLLHYSPLFEIRAPWFGPLSTRRGASTQANPGYRCHQCNGPCRDRTPGCSLQSPTPKPLGYKGTWTTQSLVLDWFVTCVSAYRGDSILSYSRDHILHYSILKLTPRNGLHLGPRNSLEVYRLIDCFTSHVGEHRTVRGLCKFRELWNRLTA